jgi:Zn-dependent protease with chaperone function
MTQEEVEGVLAHEIAHVANGDMVTLTLIQGVVNTFVVFLARVVAYAVDSFLRRDEESSGPGIAFTVTSVVCDLLFGLLASIIVAWFSRQREFRADRGSASILGTPRPMIAALRRLGGIEQTDLAVVCCLCSAPTHRAKSVSQPCSARKTGSARRPGTTCGIRHSHCRRCLRSDWASSSSISWVRSPGQVCWQ